jgi:hypothetical protein
MLRYCNSFGTCLQPFFIFHCTHTRTHARLYARINAGERRRFSLQNALRCRDIEKHLPLMSSVATASETKSFSFRRKSYRIKLHSPVYTALNKAHAQLDRRMQSHSRRRVSSYSRAETGKSFRCKGSSAPSWGRRRHRKPRRRRRAHLLIISARCIRLPTTMIKRHAPSGRWSVIIRMSRLNAIRASVTSSHMGYADRRLFSCTGIACRRSSSANGPRALTSSIFRGRGSGARAVVLGEGGEKHMKPCFRCNWTTKNVCRSACG